MRIRPSGTKLRSLIELAHKHWRKTYQVYIVPVIRYYPDNLSREAKD